MKSYIKSLHRHVEQADKEQEQGKQQTLQPTVKPLDQQLIELLRTLDKEQLGRGWHISEFVMQLDGKYGLHPHPQQVADVLIKLNWSKRRVYNAAMGINGKRLWFANTMLSQP